MTSSCTSVAVWIISTTAAMRMPASVVLHVEVLPINDGRLAFLEASAVYRLELHLLNCLFFLCGCRYRRGFWFVAFVRRLRLWDTLKYRQHGDGERVRQFALLLQRSLRRVCAERSDEGDGEFFSHP